MTGRSNRRRMGEYTVAVLLVDAVAGTGDQTQGNPSNAFVFG